MQSYYPLITYAALYNSSQEIGAGKYWIYDSGNGEWCSIDVVDGVFVVKDGSNNNITPSGGSLTVRDIDGTPSISATTLEFTNGTVTDQGSGIARVTISGGGGTPTAITVANEATDTTCFLTFVTAATGDLGPKTNANLKYNSANSTLECTTFVGALTGTASGNLVAGGALGTPSSGTLTNCTFPTLNQNTTGSAATLTTPRTIGGVSFNGSANIVPQTIQSVNESSDTTCFLLFISASGSQSLQPLNNAGLTYNASTNALTATTFVGALTGTASGNLVSGGALGTPSSGTLTNCTALPPAGQTTAGRTQTICGFGCDGDGTALTAKTLAATFTVPVAMTLTAWSAECDTGTFTVKFWKIATGTAIPTIANVINTSGVGISTGTAIRSTTLTDFTTTAFAAGDIVRCAITAVSGATWIKVQLEGTKN